MRYELEWSMLAEITLRIALWLLFIYFEKADPFIREIHEHEVWMYQFPVTDNYIPNSCLWAVLIFFPSVSFISEYCSKKNEDAIYGALALSLSYCLTGVITAYLKVITGRPRPDFYFRCFPDGSGSDFGFCRGHKQDYMEGRKSFPSGHASFSFACMTFASLYLGRKFDIFKDGRRGHSWQLCVCLAPLLVATTVAVSRTCDYHHHYEDVAVGSLIGAAMSFLCYKIYFPKSVTAEEKDGR